MRSAENVARRRAQAERMESNMSALRGEQATHHYGKTLPLVVLDFQLLRACFRDGVELRAAVVLGQALFRLDPAAVLEAYERDVNRALVQNDRVAADLLDAPRDAVSVERAHGEQRAEDHEVQCALEDLEFVGRHTPVLWDVHRSVWPFMWYVNRRRPCPGGAAHHSLRGLAARVAKQFARHCPTSTDIRSCVERHCGIYGVASR